MGWNRARMEDAADAAGALGVDALITPEMWVSGWSYPRLMGTQWIEPSPDDWLQRFADRLRNASMAGFIGYPERDPSSLRLYNSVFVIDAGGRFVGTYRKRSLIPGAEDWACRGNDTHVFECGSLRVGLMVCADAAATTIADALMAQGAEVVFAPSSWAPGEWGPDGEWERISAETGLPVFVCNRGGVEPERDFNGSETVAVVGGKRALTYSSSRSALLVLDWAPGAERPVELREEMPL